MLMGETSANSKHVNTLHFYTFGLPNARLSLLFCIPEVQEER